MWSNLGYLDSIERKPFYIYGAARHEYHELGGYGERKYFNQIIPSAGIYWLIKKTYEISGMAEFVTGDYNGGDFSIRARFAYLPGKTESGAIAAGKSRRSTQHASPARLDLAGTPSLRDQRAPPLCPGALPGRRPDRALTRPCSAIRRAWRRASWRPASWPGPSSSRQWSWSSWLLWPCVSPFLSSVRINFELCSSWRCRPILLIEKRESSVSQPIFHSLCCVQSTKNKLSSIYSEYLKKVQDKS